MHKHYIPSMLIKAIESLIRGDSTELDAYIQKVGIEINIENTSAISYCYILTLDGNGRPRVKDLAEFISYRIIDYCIPRSEIEKARKIDTENNSTSEMIKLQKKASNLFTDIKTTGEGGEILLYILTQTILKLPQVLCKMPLKTSSQMHYHGVDGVHANFDLEKNKLALYWGESKLYKDINDAINSCFKSLMPFLTDNGGSSSPVERDLHLFRENIDLIDENLENAFLRFLDKDSPYYNQLEYRGVCLVGFNSENYPTEPNNNSLEEVKMKIEANIVKWNEKLSTVLTDKSPLNSFQLHVFLLPFPSVEDFRNAFLDELGLRN